MAKNVDIDEVTEMLESFEVYGEDEIVQAQCVDCDAAVSFDDGTGANEIFLVLLAHDCAEYAAQQTGFTPGSIEPTKQDVTRTIRGLNTLLKKSAQS